MLKKIAIVCTSLMIAQHVSAVTVPGSVPPVRMTTAGLYADDTRGIAVPEHEQFRMQANNELLTQAKLKSDNGITFSDAEGNNITPNANKGKTEDFSSQIERIANDGGPYQKGQGQQQSTVNVLELGGPQQGFMPVNPQAGAGYAAAGMPMGNPAQGMMAQSNFQMQQGYMGQPQTGMQPQMMQPQMQGQMRTVPTPTGTRVRSGSVADGGVEIAIAQNRAKHLDMKNSLVRLKEDRVSVRRVVRRMLDQIGGGSWDIVWSLSAENASLPDMEISIYTQEPFMNVLNALLARLQTRSGQSLRVIRYDNSKKLVITDQQGKVSASKGKTAGVGVSAKGKMVVTEQVLKESKVILHYDEIPLVDALENMVNQASNGQWRLRVYSGMDQVLKPAHIEEPFNIAMERILALFNLKYEIFPGGKLVVITSGGATGYTNMQQY